MTDIKIEITSTMLQSIIAVSKAADNDRHCMLNGACIRIDKNNLHIVATDGKILVEHTYTEYESAHILNEKNFIIEGAVEDKKSFDMVINTKDKLTMSLIKELAKKNENIRMYIQRR